MARNKLFTKHTFLIALLGLLINILGVKLAHYFELPVFLDSIGTVFSAALGGFLPGIVVGFFSNAINSINDPITLYYGIISVIIALLATMLSQRGAFKSFFKTLLASLLFAVIGGGLGSLLTYMLYGFSFGTGVSAPFSIFLYETLNISKFLAQFSADMCIDILDKLISLAVVFLLFKILPDKLLSNVPLGDIYISSSDKNTHKPQKKADKFDLKKIKSYRRLSLRNKVVSIIIITAMLLGTIATAIGFIVYKNAVAERYEEMCVGATNLMASEIDADSIDKYLNTLIEDDSYNKTLQRLTSIKSDLTQIEYMYVYQIREDGCHVVFDVDTADLEGASLGEVIEVEEAFYDLMPRLLRGEEIEPIISSGIYGWLLTVYKPIVDSKGRCVAYAAADIAMNDVVTDRYIFVIRMASLLFAMAVPIMAFAVWYVDRRMVEPINSIAAAASQFAYENEDDRKKSLQFILSLDIKTGDEIENLYDALKVTVVEVGKHIDSIHEKAAIIAKMQNNIIMTFAGMVESRDANTGGHIMRTARYVRVIATALGKTERYREEFNASRIDNIVRSAPLHDIGKIKISDVILNKPGKLSPVEYEIIKTHTTVGKEILESALKDVADSSYLFEAINMAAYHHERWDGSGYPCALKGEEIPISARIMAVADVFDALVSERSYKMPLAFDDAVEIIKRESGSMFDPDVVNAFISSLDEVKLVEQNDFFNS